MAKKPITTGEHIISLYGHVTGLKKDILNLKTNHLKHMHQDIEKIDVKLDQRFDTITNWIIYGLGAVALLVMTQLLYILSK
jgi:hypothetical protein